MMATTSVGGPPVLLYLLSGNDPPAVNRANIVTYYFLTQFLLIVIVLATGVAGWDALARAVVLFPVMVAGRLARRAAVSRSGQRRLYRNVALAHPVVDRPVRPAAPRTSSGTPLLNGALVSTDGTGSGTTGLLSTNTATPNGTNNTASVNLPAPVLGDTQVLPNGANGGSAAAINGGSTSTSSNSGLLNGDPEHHRCHALTSGRRRAS